MSTESDLLRVRSSAECNAYAVTHPTVGELRLETTLMHAVRTALWAQQLSEVTVSVQEIEGEGEPDRRAWSVAVHVEIDHLVPRTSTFRVVREALVEVGPTIRAVLESEDLGHGDVFSVTVTEDPAVAIISSHAVSA